MFEAVQRLEVWHQSEINMTKLAAPCGKYKRPPHHSERSPNLHMESYGVEQTRTQRNERTSMTRHKVDPVGLEAATAGGVYFFLKDVLGPGRVRAH